MAEYKKCPGCGMKNPASAIFCEKCGNDLLSVDITSEPDESNAENIQDSGSLSDVKFDELFANATEPKPVSTGGKRVIKQINVKEKTPENSNVQSFKYCTCGEPNSSSAVRCNACGADIKGVIPDNFTILRKLIDMIRDENGNFLIPELVLSEDDIPKERLTELKQAADKLGNDFIANSII